MDGERKLAGRTKIPVGDMAKAHLEALFPHATAEQCEALRNGTPLPPSPEWVGTGSDERVTQQLQQQLKEARTLAKQKIRMEGLLETLCAWMADGPMVTALLVFGNKQRIRRARKAVDQFVNQSYPHKQLVIVNATDMSITTRPHPEIKELVFPADRVPLTGTMRNYGIEHAEGSWLYPCWDDDDVYDRHLLSFAMSQRTEHTALLFTTQCRIDIQNAVAYLHHEEKGIPNTMLVPKTKHRFAEQTGGEDVQYLTNFTHNSKVVNNKLWPANMLKMVVHDGNNVVPIENFMVDHYGPQWTGRLMLPLNETEHLQNVLGLFGFRVEPRDNSATLAST